MTDYFDEMSELFQVMGATPAVAQRAAQGRAMTVAQARREWDAAGVLREAEARVRETAAEMLTMRYAEADRYVRQVGLREEARGGPVYLRWFWGRVAETLRAHAADLEADHAQRQRALGAEVPQPTEAELVAAFESIGMPPEAAKIAARGR